MEDLKNLAFKTDQFSAKPYQEKHGEEIWQFLCKGDNIVRMATAVYLSRPAVEPMSPYIEMEFGEKYKKTIHDDDVHQMIGRMAKQIMEHYGLFDLKERDTINTEPKNIFQSAQLYKWNEKFVKET